MSILYYPVQLLFSKKYGYDLQMQLLENHHAWHLTRFEDADGSSLIDAVQHKSKSPLLYPRVC